jgi:carbon monoxide dehydrogenase subunit G
MIFEGTISVPHSRDKVWDFVLDIQKFSSCMPGLDSIDQLDDTTFDGVITAKVGPISGRFNFRSSITDKKPKESLTVTIDGKDSVTASSIVANVIARLDEPQPNHTEMSYKANVDIKGRLAILGDMILRATTSLILDEFTKRLRKAMDVEAS